MSIAMLSEKSSLSREEFESYLDSVKASFNEIKGKYNQGFGRYRWWMNAGDRAELQECIGTLEILRRQEDKDYETTHRISDLTGEIQDMLSRYNNKFIDFSKPNRSVNF